MRNIDPRTRGVSAVRLGCAWLLVLGLLSGCEKPAGFKGFKPASMEHDEESGLNRIVLTEQAEQRLGIATEALKRVPVTRRRTVGGELMSPPGTSATVSAPMAGTVLSARGGTALPVPGTALDAGQVVMRFSPLVAPGRNVQVDARRDVQSARSRADNARRQADRLQQLGKEGLGNQAAFEAADADALVAEAELAAAQERLQQVTGSNALAGDVTLPLKAPQPSVLTRLLVTEGQTVAQGTPLFEMADLRRLWVRVPVYVGDLASLDRNRTATVLPLGARVRGAGVAARSLPVPAAGLPNTASAELYFELESGDESLTPGQRVLVSLPLTGDATPQKIIAHAAVLYDLHGSTWAYARVAEHTYERRRIDVDHVDDGIAVLAQGPAEGTELVVVGATELFGTEFGAGK